MGFAWESVASISAWYAPVELRLVGFVCGLMCSSWLVQPLRLPGAPVVAPARDAFGDPFLVLLKAGDTVASLRSRIQEKLGVFSSDFDTVWALTLLGRGEAVLCWGSLPLGASVRC